MGLGNRMLAGYYCEKCGYVGKAGPEHKDKLQEYKAICSAQGIPFYTSPEEGEKAPQRKVNTSHDGTK